MSNQIICETCGADITSIERFEYVEGIFTCLPQAYCDTNFEEGDKYGQCLHPDFSEEDKHQ